MRPKALRMRFIMSSGYLGEMPLRARVWEIRSPMTKRASGTACWSRRRVPITEVECPSCAKLTIRSSTSFLSVADHAGASLTLGLLDPLRPFPPLCIRAIQTTQASGRPALPL